jgi:hypothetical protein
MQSYFIVHANSPGAEPEERDSEGYTAFHIALQHGHIPILQHFFESYAPGETESKPIYNLPESRSLLSLALDSHEPEVVWMILDKNLASTHDVANAWARVSSGGGGGKDQPMKASQKIKVKNAEKAGDIRKLLMTFGGFTPPSTPDVAQVKYHLSRSSNEQSGPDRDRQQFMEQNQKHRSRPPRAPLEQLSSQSPRSNGVLDQQKAFQNRGRGHGRGRGRGRGRGAAA